MLVWLVPTLVTLHNAEEAVAFRRQLPEVPALLPAQFAPLAARLSYPVMLVALGVVSALAIAVAIAATAYAPARWPMWLLLVIEATMAINAVAHVLVAIVIFHGYAPGLVTAVVFNAPFAVYCFRRAQREQWVGPRALRATLPAAVVVHGPILIGGLWLAGLAGR
jgi:hypothetical protein